EERRQDRERGGGDENIGEVTTLTRTRLLRHRHTLLGCVEWQSGDRGARRRPEEMHTRARARGRWTVRFVSTSGSAARGRRCGRSALLVPRPAQAVVKTGQR